MVLLGTQSRNQGQRCPARSAAGGVRLAVLACIRGCTALGGARHCGFVLDAGACQWNQSRCCLLRGWDLQDAPLTSATLNFGMGLLVVACPPLLRWACWQPGPPVSAPVSVPPRKRPRPTHVAAQGNFKAAHARSVSPGLASVQASCGNRCAQTRAYDCRAPRAGAGRCDLGTTRARRGKRGAEGHMPRQAHW